MAAIDDSAKLIATLQDSPSKTVDQQASLAIATAIQAVAEQLKLNREAA